MKKVLTYLMAAALLVGMMTGCSQKETKENVKTNQKAAETSQQAVEQSQQAVESTENTGGKTFAVVVHSTQSTYWQTLNIGAEAAAAESGDTIYFTAPVNGGADINGQVDVMQNCINQKVDGILLAAADVDALVPITEEAIDSGIPVVIVDCGLNSDKCASAIATDNYGAAAQIAEKAAEDIGYAGEIAVINYAMGMQTGNLRENGFKETMAKYPDIKLIETQYYNNDTQKALEVTQNLLTANPDIKAIYATNEFGIVGSCRALMEKGNKDIKVYGFDFSDDVVPLLESGYCTGTMVQKPYDMGYLGVKTLNSVLNGEKVEKQIDSGCVLATPENYLDEDIYKVLFPAK